MKTSGHILALVISSKTSPKVARYALSDDIVKTSITLSEWNANHLISRATTVDVTVVPAAEFANRENHSKHPRSCRKAVKWLTLITKWALQEGFSPSLTKHIVEEHLEQFKHYICADTATWNDFVKAFFTKHKIDGATQFVQWYNYQRSVGRNTWFSYAELERATNKFARALKCVSEGKKGVVYEGIEQFSEQFIAVKRLKKVTDFSLREVLYEVAIHHYIRKSLNYDFVPLVNLLGFCPYPADPLLVFEYMPKGNLRQHLQGHHGNYLQSHASARLRIAVEVANALKLLHYQCESPVYHRDVKSTNILLDNCHRAKLSDLSTAKILQLKPGNSSELESPIINIDCSDDGVVVGTPGYVDPVYEETHQLNDLTDVYSFGVVLMELATHLKAWDPERPVKLLTEIVKEKMRVGKLNEIVRTSGIPLSGTARREGITKMKEMLRLGVECCSLDLQIRPRIDEVEEALLRLQDQSEEMLTGLKSDDTALAAVGEHYQKLTLETMVSSWK